MKFVLLNEPKGSKEDYWMKTLRNICPYDLNERATKHNSEVPVEKLFFLYLELSNDLSDIETIILKRKLLNKSLLKYYKMETC